MGTQGTGRKRSTKKERSTAEDDALNLIAREAEARLAAKRAARAEAREIRMKELERQQKELSDDDERMSVGSRGSVRVEDRDYLEKGSRAASALTAATLTSLGGSSSRRGSGETAVNVDAETSLREIKEIHELKDQIQDVEAKYMQNLKEVKDALVEVEEKYRKAMVSNAQLDNEKNNLMYQVDTLKDSLMELEELLAESRRGYEEKVKEYDREKHAHSVLQFQFSEMKETLKQSEELLNKHGIVLGPDLNINGEVGESEVDGSPGADPDSQPAQDSKTCSAEGNSMLGNTDENGLRSSGEEKADPEQHQEMFEEAKDSPLNSDALCDVAGVSTLETSSEEQQTYLEEDKRTTTKEDNVEESYLSKDEVESNDQSIIDAKDIIVSSPGLQGILTSPEENVPEMPEGADLGETETKSSIVHTHTDDMTDSCNNIFEEQENKQEDEEINLRNTESFHQQTVALDVVKVCLPDESVPVPVVSNPEPQQEDNNAGETENDEAEEMSRKAQPQGAAASGKKKKRKRRGKKKGGAQEEHNQQKGGTDREKSKTKMDRSTEPEINGSITETLEESRVDQVKNERDSQKTDEVDGEEAVKPIETFSPSESLQESRMDHGTDGREKDVEEVEAAKAVETEAFSHVETPEEGKEDHGTDELNKELSLESEAVETVEAVKPAPVDTLNESTADPGKEQDEEQILETEKVADIGSITETNFSTSDLIDNSKDDHVKESSSSLDISKGETDISKNDNVIHAGSEIVDNAEDEVRSIDEMQSESSTDNPETTCETSGKQNSEAESHVPSSGDIAADESESVISPQSKADASVSDTDGFTDAPKSFVLSVAIDSDSNNSPIEVSGRRPEETNETVKDDEKLGSESKQESCSPSADGEDSELNAGKIEQEELNGVLKEAECLVEPDDDEESDHDSASLTKTADTFDNVKSPLETAALAEQLDEVESQSLQCEDQIDESNAEPSSELEELNTIDSLKEATEIGSPIEQDQRSEESTAVEDLEHKNSQNNQHSEMQQLHESSKDKSDDYDSSQPTLQESDEEDGEDDEGQSFDFDDMDVEVAVATSLLEYPKEEEVEEKAKVMPDESNNSSLSNESREDELVESIDDTVDEGHQTHTKPRDAQNSLTHEDITSDKGENVFEMQKNLPEQEVGVADEPRHITEEGKALNVGELGVVAEDINQTKSLPTEEGLHAIKHETPGENLDLPKSAEQVASNKEPQQTGKDVRKNNKKGKGKGKEECKMS